MNGYASLGYTDEYFQYADRVLDKNSDRKTVIIGLTPNSLTDKASTNNSFVAFRKKLNVVSYAKAKWLGWTERSWAPATSSDLKRAIGRIVTEEVSSREHDDGWIEVFADQNEAKMTKTLQYYETMFRHSSVSESQIASIIRWTNTWTSRGVKVYGFRPPTCGRMETIENSHSGFLENSLISRFRQAGGNWLELSREGLISYDGSHLNSASARLLSRRIGQQLIGADKVADIAVDSATSSPRY